MSLVARGSPKSKFTANTPQTVTATGTTGNFTLSLRGKAGVKHSGWIRANVFGGDVATNEEVKEVVEIIAGEVRTRYSSAPI